MPRPVRDDQRYLPGLDGLRALAVAAVIAYHLNLGWAQGGLLGVGVFFTLSGYLITDIFLSQWASAGRLRLGNFWLRRARRLLPGLYVMIALVSGYVLLFAPVQRTGLRGNVIASFFYVSNWWYIGQHASYFGQFAPPSPLDHLWSLAVEEQFYLLWPLLLLLGLRLVRKRWLLVGLTLLAAAASAVTMAVLYRPGFDPTRVYEGTDTRAFGLLFGAALAMLWPTRPQRAAMVPSRPFGGGVTAAGVLGLGVIGWLEWHTSEYSAFMFRGGMVVLSLATVLVIAAVAHPASPMNAVLGWGPLRWLGVRSYGIYLWHYPVILLATPPLGQLSGVQDVLCVAASVALAALSWKFVEDPIRRGVRPSGWQIPDRLRHGRAVPAAVVVTLLATGTVVALNRMAKELGSVPVRAGAAASNVPGKTTTARAAKAVARPVQVVVETPTGPDAGRLRTTCRAVVHIGDSTSDGLDSSDYLPDWRDRIPARYAAVGAGRQIMEISGGRSIVETLPNQQNGYTVAKDLAGGGYRGCWVLALGTDDTADVDVGSYVSRYDRIKRMMSVIGSQPVLWVNVKTLVPYGPYAEYQMRLWNDALIDESRHYPNMRVYDWASAVRDSWFINDGIHYTSTGYRYRARMIAEALASAFPGPEAPAPPPAAAARAGARLPVTASPAARHPQSAPARS
jgi:peptidoglycan/LPS O-acetylase OafA/YrhL